MKNITSRLNFIKEQREDDPYDEEYWDELIGKTFIYTGHRLEDKNGQPAKIVDVIVGECPRMYNPVRDNMVVVGPLSSDLYRIRFDDGTESTCLKKFLKEI